MNSDQSTPIKLQKDVNSKDLIRLLSEANTNVTFKTCIQATKFVRKCFENN